MYATEQIYVMALSPPSVFTRTTKHLGTCHSDPYHLDEVTRWSENDPPWNQDALRAWARIHPGY
jgi:hypothetical protein